MERRERRMKATTMETLQQHVKSQIKGSYSAKFGQDGGVSGTQRHVHHSVFTEFLQRCRY